MALIALEDGAYDPGTGRVQIRRGDTVTATHAQLIADIVVTDNATGLRQTERRYP